VFDDQFALRSTLRRLAASGYRACVGATGQWAGQWVVATRRSGLGQGAGYFGATQSYSCVPVRVRRLTESLMALKVRFTSHVEGEHVARRTPIELQPSHCVVFRPGGGQAQTNRLAAGLAKVLAPGARRGARACTGGGGGGARGPVCAE